jgi:hypothetical protein
VDLVVELTPFLIELSHEALYIALSLGDDLETSAT